ncbi:type III-A CRISPR-associated protein Csm2 [Syntrophomonas wolfei]|uniref:CRISPR system Cms protein Csm2 n=1 Tax=Syntrophomonas wolfei subsp. wolfei (strain DSM 2245B / Goettingen) TaxID=335541 RepID=Q0AW51_SYNWW|nr:type III-A CRISPR-associated protein Csm2 [Syntrophomonas wolfei]ABI69053.1 hypothetical protein Swol_1755 [Syntrophomonas wolfei subsp. wolfei str. Goettingen G311]
MSNMREAFRKAGYKDTQAQTEKPSQSQPAVGQFQLGINYTAQAEQVIQELKKSMGRNYQNFTTSKIRNILAQVSEIYNDVRAENDVFLSPDLQNRIEYLKVRLVYECGREPWIIKPFVDKAKLLDLLNNIGDNRQNFIKFARYMEALVAYHRFYGGRD